MNETLWTQFFGFQSDNRKSKTCPELSRRGQNLKLAGLFAVVVSLVGCAGIADAQQPAKVPRIGYLDTSGDPSAPSPRLEAFRQGLRDLGYIEGKNILAEYRYGEGKVDRSPSLVAELVQLKVDILVVSTLPAIRAAQQATKTIPIVMVTTQDPVATGLIDSLARPGGNMTGLATLGRELSGKRLELFKETVPRLSRVGVLWDANARGQRLVLRSMKVRRVL